MRIGATFLSAVIHAGVVAAGLFVIQAAPKDRSMSTMIPINLDLVTIGDVTDIMSVTEDAKIDEEAKTEEAEPVASATPVAPVVEEDSVALEPAAKPKKEEPKKQEAKPAPAKSARDELNSFLDDTLAGIQKNQPKPQGTASKSTNTTNQKPQLGANAQKRMQVTIEDAIRAQLVNNRCWTDHSDMADAPRLAATFRVWFSRSGKFAREPQLIDPTREPSGDPPLQVFVQLGRTALQKCNTIGWRVPEEYFQLPNQPAYIDIEMVPKVAAMR
jgi:outer membrane biosynthesis protein TonB